MAGEVEGRDKVSDEKLGESCHTKNIKWFKKESDQLC